MRVRGTRSAGSLIGLFPPGSIAVAILAQAEKHRFELTYEQFCEVLAEEIHYFAWIDWHKGRDGRDR